MKKTIPTVGILVFSDNKVLLVRHGEKSGHLTGTYGLPAGRIDKDESEKDAAVRELQEETGLATKPESLDEYPNNHYSAVLERKDGESREFVMAVFICRTYEGSLRGTDETEPIWVRIDDIMNYPTVRNIRKVVEDARPYITK